jgi:diguanylate cyclase (GGDEF)-like protein
MDVKANTHFCESPITSGSAESPPPPRPAAYLIVIQGGLPGTMLRVSDDENSMGRSAENAFHFYDITVSRRHANVRIDSRGEVLVADQGSTNGTFVNGQKLEPHRPRRMRDGDRIQLGTGVLLKLVLLDPSDEDFQQQMFERTVRDGLTGLYNRSYFLSQIGGFRARHGALGIGLAVLMVDVDHFKHVNDRYGHVAGDAVLREVGGMIRESTRGEDLVARYGGEEFIAALPVSAPDLASERAERIRSNVSERVIRAGGQEIRVSVSIGLVFCPTQWRRSETSLIEAADEALYKAKMEGRNRVVLGRCSGSPIIPETQSAEFLTSL